jgi:hypothetical protein
MTIVNKSPSIPGKESELRECIQRWVSGESQDPKPLLALIEVFEHHDKLLNLYSVSVKRMDESLVKAYQKNSELKKRIEELEESLRNTQLACNRQKETNDKLRRTPPWVKQLRDLKTKQPKKK